ncbi:copper chaperone PCu(A)C [Erythrobacter alti]|uniref:copper chaperone PCu(A)C n=1 Tax=Erythrobacter alti TaxID=1896145 RepID=UPI0030F3D96C
MKSIRVLGALSSAGLAIVLASCGTEEAEAPVEAAAGDCPPGISVTDGWLALPAVSGNPAAVYFTITNDTESQVTIRTASVLGAGSAMLHETAEWSGEMDMQELFTQPLLAGETLEFEPGGKHVMAFDMGEGTEPGGETEATLTFVGGDKCSFPVTAHPAGEDPRESADEA